MGKSVKFPVPKFSVACAAAGIILYAVLLIFQGGKWVPVSSLQRASHGEGELLYEVMVRELGEEGREIPVTTGSIQTRRPKHCMIRCSRN